MPMQSLSSARAVDEQECEPALAVMPSGTQLGRMEEVGDPVGALTTQLRLAVVSPGGSRPAAETEEAPMDGVVAMPSRTSGSGQQQRPCSRRRWRRTFRRYLGHPVRCR